MIQVVYLYPLFASLVFSLAIQSKRVTKLTRRCSNNARQWVGNKPLCRRQAAATYRGGGGGGWGWEGWKLPVLMSPISHLVGK